MRTLLQDFYPDLETALAALPIKPPVGRAMTQDEFFTFCQQNRKLPFERNAKGEVSLSPAYGVLGSFQISSIVYQLGTWANERKPTRSCRASCSIWSRCGGRERRLRHSLLQEWVSP